MNHFKQKRKFGRYSQQRTALLRSLARSLVIHEQIETTEAKAKELRPVIERMITHAKKGGVSVQRMLVAEVGKDSAKKLLTDIAPRYTERAGGYTRITKLAPRVGDGSPMAVISFV